MHIKEDSDIEIIKYFGTHSISQSHILLDSCKEGTLLTMPRDLMLREHKSLALLWVLIRLLGLILYPRNHTVTRFGLRYLRARCGFRSGTWTMGPFWCFGSWRKKSLVLLWVLWLLTLRGGFSKTVRFPKVPGNCL